MNQRRMSGDDHVGTRNLTAGIVLITAAFFCAAVMSALSKAASNVSPLLLLFLQYGISFLVFLPALAKEGPGLLKTQHPWLQIFRSVAGSICQLLFFIAVKSIALMDAVLLSNAAPLFIPLVVWVWFRKTVQPLGEPPHRAGGNLPHHQARPGDATQSHRPDRAGRSGFFRPGPCRHQQALRNRAAHADSPL